jgi:hypothetical protein
VSRSLAKLFVFVLLGLSSLLTLHAQPSPPTEYELKAAFLYRLARYVEWPAAAFTSPGTNLVLGILGEDPFGHAFDEAPTWQPINGRKFVVKRCRTLEEAARCHLVYVSASERRRLRELFEAFGQAPLLTIGDQEKFAQQGGVVTLVWIEKKLRFEINVDAAERARLKLDPQLLNTALRLYRGGRVKQSTSDRN